MLPCETPRTPPAEHVPSSEPAPTMTAMLTEIRDEARAQTAILRAMAEQMGLDPTRVSDMNRATCGRAIESPFGNATCRAPGGHFGPCVGNLK